MKKVYIAGKISGNPDYVSQFKSAEKLIADKGFIPVNPVQTVVKTYKEYIMDGLLLLSNCDYIYLIDGWETSLGANLEKVFAETVGIKRIIF